jgi:hydrogenase nickel incorporation protein HypA/HybF
MHELPVTQGILDVVLKAAGDNGGGRIASIDLVIGELASVVDDSVQFYFDILSKGTLAEGARLRFRRLAASALCLDCQHTFAARAPLTPACPQCGGARLRVSGGREFYVESIDVNESADRTANPER